MESNSRRIIGGAVVAIALLAIVGSGVAFAQGSGSSLVSDVDDDDSIPESNVTLSEQEAIDIATAEANGTVDEVELETEDGAPVYEVELVTANGSETEVAVHADDGTVLETESEEDEDEREDEEMDDEDEQEDEEADDEDEYEDSDDE